MKNRKKVLNYMLSFIIPVCILIIISIRQGFCPFGDKTLFIMDMKGQYLEFFASLRNIFNDDNSIFFSWSRSMGGNFLGLFAYYVASPLSFITVLFPLEKMAVAIWLLTVLKIGLCGISFYTFASYLQRRYCNDEMKEKSLPVLVLSVSYALISYNMVYSMCLMWLDGVIFLPIVIMGLMKILDGAKGYLYLASITCLFICNYYTGYMIGLFAAIFFVYRLVCMIKRDDLKSCIKSAIIFFVNTILAICLSSPIILPVVKDLMMGKMSMDTDISDAVTNFEFVQLFGKFLNGRYDSITNTGLPSIYCGIVGLLFALVFFVMKRISIREKAGAVVVLAMLVCSFYFTKIDAAWHGFKQPTWFPYRYAFIFSFFILYMACRCVTAFNGIKKAWVSYTAGVLLLIITSVDLGINANAMINGLDNEFGYGMEEEYKEFVNSGKKLVDEIKSKDDGLYRINQNYEYSKNDAMLLGYNGMTHYSSTFNKEVNFFIQKFGIAQSHIWNSGYGDTPLLDSLFGVRYILDDGEVPSCYNPVMSTEDGKTVYSNKMCVPFVYNAEVSALTPDFSSDNPFVNQNTFLNTIAGTDNEYFKDLEYTYNENEAGFSYTFNADSTDPVYMYMRTPSLSWADIYVNGQWVGNYFSTETTCNIYLGTFKRGEQVTVECIPSGAVEVSSVYIDKLDIPKLNKTLEMLNSNGMAIEKHSGGKLSGKIDVKEGQRIMTSIPYDEGWTIKVDGNKISPEKYSDTFISFKADAGVHDISFSYVSPGVKEGMVLCIIAGVIIAFIIVMSSLRRWRIK